MDQKENDCLSKTQRIAWQRSMCRRAWGRGPGGGAGGQGVHAWLLNSAISSARSDSEISSTAYLLLVGRGSITYRRIISCVGGAFLHHCSCNHSDTVSNLGCTQSAIWHLHSQRFGMYTVSNLAFTQTAIWHTYIALQQHSMERPPCCMSTF